MEGGKLEREDGTFTAKKDTEHGLPSLSRG